VRLWWQRGGLASVRGSKQNSLILRPATGLPKRHIKGVTLMVRSLVHFLVRACGLGLAALLAATVPQSASAQSYPSRLVKIVVPFSAGSVTDIMARIVAAELTQTWGQQVIVENRPGISGTVAVAQAKPDGYTLMLTSNGHTVAGLTSKDLPFDPVKDFAGITRVCSAPYVLIVNPEVKATSLKELIALTKENPGKYNFSSPGLGSSTFIGGALFRRAAGIDVVHVPYKGAPESVLAVLRGEVQFYFAPINLAKELAEAGKVRALAVATPARNPSMPNVPTFAEAGLPFSYDGWFGLMAPRGVPAEIIAKVNKDVVAILHKPEVQEKLAQQFVIPVTDTPEAFDKIIRDETANLTQVFKEAGIGGN
jgi:tripartite-type tricarboxylate transporter receptor subunit TctC